MKQQGYQTCNKPSKIIYCQNKIMIQQKHFLRNLAIEMKRTWKLMNKAVYLGLSILEISITVIYEFWYD